MTEYKTIEIDYPWPERGGGRRGAENHFRVQKVRDAPQIILTCPMYNPADRCHLWFWVTNTYLEAGLRIIDVLGFRYITNTVWVKTAKQMAMDRLALNFEQVKIGLGQYQRNAHELLLLAVRGRAMVPPPEDRLPSVVFAPPGEHSEKPPVFHERIERVSPGPRLEMFARRQSQGWDCWGDELK